MIHIYSYGSNSQKTVEYFSKALGEKTISRDNVSVNKDKQQKKTGTSESDQIMARALMTPDELRRMSMDLCIIFEKGLKPIKAEKFYYFKTPIAKELAECEISHNDIGEIERGKWRKYNPYNPYVEDDEEKTQTNDLNIESLDDLFDDDFEQENNEKEEKNIQPQVGVEVPNDSKLDIENIMEDDLAPMMPMGDEEEDQTNDEEYDLQKELEAKFDELFGPIDDNE